MPILNHLFFRLKKPSSIGLSSYNVSALYLVVVTIYWAPPGLATSYLVVGKNWMQHSKRSPVCAIPLVDVVATLLLVQPRMLLSQSTLLVHAQFAVHQESQVPLHRATPQTVISQPGLLQVFIPRSSFCPFCMSYGSCWPIPSVCPAPSEWHTSLKFVHEPLKVAPR